MENLEYIYNGQVWTQALTVPDENSFFHGVFGTNADEVYYDKHAKVRRLRWATFLTYFQNETKPTVLVDILKKCLLAQEEYKGVSLEDNEQFDKYISGIISTDKSVSLEEIPIIATLENVKVTVLLDKKGESVVTAEPNMDIIGVYKVHRDPLKEVVLCFEEHTYSKLESVNPPPPKPDRRSVAMKEVFSILSGDGDTQQSGNLKAVKLMELLINSCQGTFLERGNPYGIPERNVELLVQFDQCFEYLQTLALKFVFEPEQYNLFVSLKPQADETLQKNVMSLNIVERLGNKYHFTHKMFAEYFIARALIKELELQNQNVEFQRFLIEEILMKPDYIITRAFFNKFLRTTDSIPSNVLHNYLSYTGQNPSELSSQLLHLLCCEDCIEITRFLFKCIDFKPIKDKDVHVNEIPTNISGNSLMVLQYLVQRGGVNIKASGGVTPMHATVQAGHADVVRFLVEQGGDVNCKDDEGITPLHYASKSNINIVKVLVELGADVNAVDGSLRTPLHCAASDGSAEIVRFLVEHGAFVNALRADGFVPMHDAIIRGRWEIAKLLVELGALFKVPGSQGDMLLNLYASRGQLDYVRYIAGLGADLDTLDDLGDSALSLAITRGALDLVKCLVELGADVNRTARGGETLLVMSAKYGNLDFVKYFVEHGADIKTKGRGGLTALHYAAMNGNIDMVKYLAEVGMDLNGRTNDGDTALHWAAAQSRPEVVRFLIEHGVDSSVSNNTGLTAFQAAESMNNLSIVELFRELKCV